jgi:hypothetical protein
LEQIDNNNLIIDGETDKDKNNCIGKEIFNFVRIDIVSIQAVAIASIQQLSLKLDNILIRLEASEG